MRVLLPLLRILAANATGDHHHHHSILTDEQWFLYIGIVVGLVLLAGLMSGLTLGLMSIDVLDMEVGNNCQDCQKICAHGLLHP